MAAGGAFGTTMPGSGSKVTVSAKASCTGPRSEHLHPLLGIAGTGCAGPGSAQGSCESALFKPKLDTQGHHATTAPFADITYVHTSSPL